MNHVFRTIWSKALGTWVVASELTTGRCKSSREKRCSRALLAGVSVGAMFMCGWSVSASAQVWKGTTSTDWTVGRNWSTGTAPSGTGAVTINTNSPNPAVLSVSGAVSSTIGNLQMGMTAGTSALTVQNGSTLSSSVATGSNFVGGVAGANATMTVTGPGASWSTAAGVIVGGATTSTGTLNIVNGATVSKGGSLGLGQGGVGGTGVMNLTGGSTLTSGLGTLFAVGGSNTTANISGAGSRWNVNGALTVGRGQGGSGSGGGSGTLSVASAAVVTATGVISNGGPALSIARTGAATITGAGSPLNTTAALKLAPGAAVR